MGSAGLFSMGTLVFQRNVLASKVTNTIEEIFFPLVIVLTA